MRYSLLSRFQGALLGAAVGEIIGAQSQGESMPDWQKLWPGVGYGMTSQMGQVAAAWGSLGLASAQSLIQYGRLDVENWKQSCIVAIPGIVTKGEGWAGVAIATLPVALFFHEDEAKLRIMLQQATQGWENAPVLEGALAIGYAIAQSLTEKLNPDTLIPQTIAYIQDSFVGGTSENGVLVQQLALVQSLLKEGASLEMAVQALGRHHQEESLPSPTIALAFYCFLNTIEDMRLSVSLGARTVQCPQIAAALTGALSGAYNSIAGIPVVWRTPKGQSDVKISESPSLWGMKSASGMLQLGDRLLAAWSGVYDTADLPIEPRWSRNVGAPRVIRLV